MSEGLISRMMGRMARKAVNQAVGGGLADQLHDILVSYKIRPREERIYDTEAEVQAHLEGYSDAVLNEYIVAKSARWLESLKVNEFVVPPHLYGLLFIIEQVQARLNRPIRIIDFGGGAPTLPVVLRQLGVDRLVESYRIVESPAFVDKVPADWKQICTYSSRYEDEPCDLLILSSVLPYLSRSIVQSVYGAIRKAPPRFIYFGRTSFLADDYPRDEAFTIQVSRFRDHGAQVDVGMAHVENNMAHYVKRHFKWSEVSRVIDPLGYRRAVTMSDDSGLENIKGLGLYSNNSLWERAHDAG